MIRAVVRVTSMLSQRRSLMNTTENARCDDALMATALSLRVGRLVGTASEKSPETESLVRCAAKGLWWKLETRTFYDRRRARSGTPCTLDRDSASCPRTQGRTVDKLCNPQKCGVNNPIRMYPIRFNGRIWVSEYLLHGHVPNASATEILRHVRTYSTCDSNVGLRAQLGGLSNGILDLCHSLYRNLSLSLSASERNPRSCTYLSSSTRLAC